MATFAQLEANPDEQFDQRRGGRPVAAKELSSRQNRDLFRKCVEYDFDYLMGLKFAAPRETLQDLLPQSLLGRAQNGHGWFMDEDGLPLKFVDATFDQICTILENHTPQLANLKVRARRNAQIERLQHQVLAHIDQPRLRLEDAAGPLFGVDFLAGREVDTRALLTGMLLAAAMDSYRWRMEILDQRPDTFAGTPLELGGGEFFAVNRERYAQSGLINNGEQVFSDVQLDELRGLEVLFSEDKEYSYPRCDQAYFRRADGLGISDDLAMLYIGKIYGYDAMLGAFLMDAVDSYDKFLLRFHPGGMDSHIAATINRARTERGLPPLVAADEIHKLIHFAAKRNTPGTLLSSSHRRFIQYEDKSELPTLLHHWAFLQEQPLKPIKLGFGRVEAKKFYHTATERFYSCGIFVREAIFR
ncbi:MAG: hypothetical protein C0622_06965 [Desulfuromonas sp.]|nr:MAG: hypothetical protein C0622_06965 [Desulfuromonas sp.]